MKTLNNILILLLLLCSCKEPIKVDKKDQGFGSETRSTQVPNDKTFITKEVETSTGKLFFVKEEKKSASISDIIISTAGFSNSNETFRINDADPLSGIFLMDLNNDGYEELYVTTTGSGSGAYGSIYGYSSNKDKSVSPIYVSEITENELLPEKDFYGYMGHDSIYVLNKTLFRKFPIYLKDDDNCCPSGGIKILSYSLKQGEATWLLKVN